MDAREHGDGVDDGFYARLVQASQGATAVVARDGTIRFISRAGHELFGYDADELVGRNMAAFIDPDDLAEMLVAFEGVQSDESRWPPALVGLLARDGTRVPAEVAGHGTFDDPVLQGAVYSIHRMDETQLLHRILAALAVGEPLGEVLRLVTELVAVPPLHLQGAALYDAQDHRFRSLAAAALGPAATEALAVADPGLPWSPDRVGPCDRMEAPALTLVEDLPGPAGRLLREAGYLECWVSPVVLDGDRVVGAVVALTLATTLPGATMRQRMRRARDVAELAFVRRDHEDQLRHAALHDGLTRLPNRTRFFDALEHGVGQRGGPRTGVAYLDLDGFKPLNDTYGHDFGDRVLVEVAARVEGALRPHDLVARLGGDEFAVLFEDLHDTDEGGAVARRLLDVVQAPMTIDGVSATVGVSIGLAVGPSGGDRSALLHAADQAMYEAKRAGRGSLRVVEL